MQNQDNQSKLKAIIGILAVLLIGSLIYIFKLTSDAKTLQTTVIAKKELNLPQQLQIPLTLMLCTAL